MATVYDQVTLTRRYKQDDGHPSSGAAPNPPRARPLLRFPWPPGTCISFLPHFTRDSAEAPSSESALRHLRNTLPQHIRLRPPAPSCLLERFRLGAEELQELSVCRKLSTSLAQTSLHVDHAGMAIDGFCECCTERWQAKPRCRLASTVKAFPSLENGPGNPRGAPELSQI